MKILAIETSCDETAAAVTEGRRVLSNVIFSQVDIHKKWGGVYPTLAKREHEKKIDPIVEKALKNARVKIEDVGAVAVTFGPGLVIALEVGIRKAKELAEKYQKPLIPVDHLEGHIYSCFAQNRNGKPKRDFKFPFLALIASGGHTSLVMVKDHLKYEIIGQTLDDALGEALDKAAKILGMAYPGGPIMERLAEKGRSDYLELPLPLARDPRLAFSYSGLKTAFKNRLANKSQKEITKNLPHLAASFQEAAFAHLLDKLGKAITKSGLPFLTIGGGVIANKKLRFLIRELAREKGVEVYFPYSDKLIGDNAAMIGVAAHYKYKKGVFLKTNLGRLDRVARPNLKMWIK
jgi:N6-L-threonylcarbamoyladenine synthase